MPLPCFSRRGTLRLMRFNRVGVGINPDDILPLINGEYRLPEKGNTLLALFSLQNLQLRDNAEAQRGNSEAAIEKAVEFIPLLLRSGRIAFDADN